MRNSQFLKIATGVLILGSFSFFYSCKEKTITPTDAIPDEDKIASFELNETFFEPSFKVQLKENAPTNLMPSPHIGLGEIKGDPSFGNVSADAYFQLAPFDFFGVPDGFELDSAFLILPYSGEAYGDTLALEQTNFEFTASTVASGLKNPKLYNQDQTFPLSETIGVGTFNLTDILSGTIIGEDTIKNSLALRLTDSYVQTILELPEPEFTSTGIFLEAINGFHIKAEKLDAGANGGLFYFSMVNTDIKKTARIAIYGTRNEKSMVLNLGFIANSTNYFTHLEKGTNPAVPQYYDGEKHSTNDIIIEGTPGLYTEVTINNLQDIPVSIIHRATLSFVNLPNTQIDQFGLPNQLIIERVRMVDGEEVVEKVPDYGYYDGVISPQGLKFVGGNQTLTSILGLTHGQYALNFPKLLQNAIKEGEEELTLRISILNERPGAFRMIGGGAGNAEDRLNVKIKVVGTKI